MPSRYRSGGLGKANLFDTNVKATQIDEDIFTDKEVLSSIADDDLVLLLDVSEDPDEIKYMTKSNFVSGLTVLTGSTDNTLVTVTGANAISGEANLLFDGTILTNDGGEIDIDISSGDPHLSFQIGGTDEFTIGVDDSDSDIFKIDTGGTVGGATKLSIDTSGNVIIAGGLTTGSTSFVNSSGVIQVASQTNITGVGTISTGTWQGTAIASAYLDSDTAHLTGTQTFSGVKTFSSGFARGSDAEGDILYSNGSAYVRLARGSDDQVLTLASGVPSWATPTVGDITGVSAGVGLSGGGTTGDVTLTLDLSELSDVTPANGDKLATIDSDGSTEQLTTVASLATLFAGTGLTASSSVIGVDASQAITALTGGDLTIYEDANNADVSLKMGTSATESLSIEVLNGGSNKTAEEVRITTSTASATANHGKIAIYIDGAEILDIDDGGIDMASGMTVALNGTDIVSSPITALNSATANELVTVGSTTTELDAEANLTFGSDILALTSSSASLPRIDLTNTHAGATSPVIRFNKDSSSGDDNDVMGRIEFYGTDAGENTHQELAYIDSYIIDSAHGSEASGIRFYVAENDATLTLGLQILGQADDDSEVDVILGAGAASTTTIAGTLTMGSTAALTNAGLVAVANQSNITGVGTISSGTWEATDVAVAHGGTGASTLTANGVLIGNGTSAVTAVDLSTKGKILIGDGSGNPQALSIGSNDQVLTADSSEATGVKWADASGGGGITVTAGQKFKAGAPLVLSRYSLKAEAAHLHPYYHVEHQTTEASSPCQALGKTLSDGKRIGVIGYTVSTSCKVRPFTIDPFVNIDSAAHVTWGTETEVYNNITGSCLSISYDETANRFLYAYSHGDSGSSGYRKAHTRVVQIDDDMSVTLGSEQEISTNTVYNGNDGSPALCYIGGTINRHVIMYGNNSSDSTSYGFYRVLTLTGSSTNSVALGTEATFSGNERGYNIMLSPDTVTSSGNSGKFMLVFFSDEDGSNKHKAVIGTVTGGSTNTIAFGTEVNYYTGTQGYPGYDGAQLAFNTDRSMWAVMFDKGVQTEGDTSAGERNTVWMVSLEVSGTTITVDTANEVRIDNGNSAGGSLRGMFLMYHQGQQCYYAGGFDSTNSFNFTAGAVEQAADGSFSLSSFTTNSSYQAVSEPGTGANSDSAYLYDKGSGTLVLHWQQTSSYDGYLTLMNFTGWNATNQASIRGNGIVPNTNFVGIAAADADYGDSVEITTYGAVASSINSIYGLAASMQGQEIYVQTDGNYNTSSGNVQVGVALSSSSILVRPDIV